MIKYREILRLLSLGLSQRHIASSLNVVSVRLNQPLRAQQY